MRVVRALLYQLYLYDGMVDMTDLKSVGIIFETHVGSNPITGDGGREGLV